MAWAKLDDRYDDNPKIKRAWLMHMGAVGLHSMAVTYCCRHELDGLLGDAWIKEKLPVKRDRDAICAALVECGLFEVVADGFVVHDFLDFNPSREELRERREKDRVRKASKQKSHGSLTDSARKALGIHKDAVQPSRAPAGAGRDGTGNPLTGSQGFRQLTRELVDEVVTILSAIPRWLGTVDEVGIENGIGVCPDVDPLQGARLAVSWGAGPDWEMPAVATFVSAMQNLDAKLKGKPLSEEQQQTKARRSRGADALRGLRAISEGTA